MKFAGRGDLVNAINLVGARRSHTILLVLTDDDAHRLVNACAAPTTVSRRDAAITLLALLTGLRACDIIDLRLRDIDWRAQTISLVQPPLQNSGLDALGQRRPRRWPVSGNLAEYLFTPVCDRGIFTTVDKPLAESPLLMAGEWKSQGEGCSPTGGAFNHDAAAMRFDQALADR